MLICEIRDLTPLSNLRGVTQNVENLARQFGLTTKLKREKSERIHWHLARAKERGVLEVTFDVSKPSLVVTVHRNREGTWARAECPRFAKELARQLRGKTGAAREEQSDGIT
jgi:hypothetical protein